MEKKDYAMALVRIAMSLVFLWFGLNQLFQPEEFMGYLPGFLLTLDFAKNLVVMNGIFEVVLGSLLLVGLYTRIAALILSLHLFAIAVNLGYNDIAVRDLGLSLTTLAVFLGGNEKWSLDKRRKH